METKRDEIQEEALNKSLEYNRCSLVLSMRTGKTLIGLKRINKLWLEKGENLRVLVAAPKLAVYQSWIDDATKFGMGHLIPLIKFTTYRSLAKQSIDYDIFIPDEVHSLLATHISWLSTYKGIILGLTGTPPRNSSSATGRIMNAYCPVVYRYITNDAVEDNVLNDYRIIIHMIDIDSGENMSVKTKNGGSFKTSELKTYNFWSKRVFDAIGPKQKQIASVMRMKAMMDFPSKVNYAKKLLLKIEEKCIIFANTQDQADKLCSYSYHANNKESEANLNLFKKGIIDKMSCVLQVSEGVTINNLRQAVVLHSYGNEKKFLQRFGRCLGLIQDEIATIHVLCYEETVDEKWVNSAMEDLDPSKIKKVKFNL